MTTNKIQKMVETVFDCKHLNSDGDWCKKHKCICLEPDSCLPQK